MCIDMLTDMCADMCTDVCKDICIDLCSAVPTNVRRLAVPTVLTSHQPHRTAHPYDTAVGDLYGPQQPVCRRQ